MAVKHLWDKTQKIQAWVGVPFRVRKATKRSPVTHFCSSHAFARKDSSQRGIYKQLNATVWDCVARETGTRELLSKGKISSSSETVIESNSGSQFCRGAFKRLACFQTQGSKRFFGRI